MNEDRRFYIGLFITFCITSFMWMLIGDYFINELYCTVNNSFTGEYNKTSYHYPSMIINYEKNMTNTYVKGWINDSALDSAWLNKSYKEKYLNNSD